MPLPWKKTRVTRISQFVADLQTPKRGGSLVVQTGFPTSLIDLFVKNRDHLKKPSKKHKTQKNKSSRLDDRVDDRIRANSETGSSNFSILVRPSSEKVETLMPKEGNHGVEATGFRVLGETHVEDRVIVVEECVGGNWRSVLLAVVKMFVVVFLALSTKKLAVGVTLSAFLLVFLEYAGKHLVFFLKPCSNAKLVLKSLAQRVSVFSLFLDDFHESDDLKGVIARENTGDVVFELIDTRSEEIEIVEPSNRGTLIDFLGEDYEKMKVVDKGSACLDQTGRERNSTLVEMLDMDYEKKIVVDKRRVCADKPIVEKSLSLVELLGKDYKKIKVVKGGEDRGEFVADEKNKGSKHSKIKLKLIKKFVPKKLRKKGKQNEPEPEPSSEVTTHIGDDKVEIFEEVEDHRDVKQEELDSENISVLSLDSEEKCESQGFVGVSDHAEGSLDDSETSFIVERKGGEREGNFGYLILFLIVLAGLFGGRIVALMLTITFCFMSKLIGTLRRLVKVCPQEVAVS